MKIAVIGAGLSGCNIYNKLIKEHDITIFEKSRGVGGRLSTKYVDDKFIDHGTSSFETNGISFENFSNKLVSENILKKSDEIYTPTNGINKVCSILINKKDLITNQRIVEIKELDGKFFLLSEKGDTFKEFDKVILTIPAPQILEIKTTLSKNILTKLKKVTYDSVATLICYSNNILNLEHPKLLESDFFSKIINNSHKYEYKRFSSYVFHTNKEFSNKVKDLKKEEIADLIYKKIEKLIGVNVYNECYTIPHLWKYAKVNKYLDEQFLYENNIGICGDYFDGNNLEATYLSSTKLCEKIQKEVKC